MQSKDFFFLEVHLLWPPRWILWVNWLWFSSVNSICKHCSVLLLSARD